MMILITGATGLLGNCLTRELIARGEAVRVFTRARSDRRPLADLSVTRFAGELADRQAIERAMTGCSAVVHCAAYIHLGWDQLELSRLVNVEGTRQVADVARQLGCRMVHVSSVDALPVAVDRTRPLTENCVGRPNVQCAYVISKREAEKVVWEYSENGLDALILNPGFMLGPFDWKPSSGRMLLELSQAPVVIAPRGGASVCDVRDVAAAAANSIKDGRHGQRYILAGTNILYRDLWAKMLHTLGQNRRVYRFPYAVAASGPIFDLLNRLGLRRRATPNGAEIAMGGLYHYYDSTKARQELRYSTRPLEQTIHDAWSWLLEHHLDR